MKFVCIYLFSIIFVLNCAFQDKRLQGLDEDINRLMDTFHTVGMAVVIVEKDSIIYNNGFGFRDLELKKPITSNTLFGIGSISKQFTSSLIGIYEGRQHLDLNDRPATYIEGLDFYTDEMDSLINIEDLLIHRSGIGNCDAAMVFFPTNDLIRNARRLEYLRSYGQVRQGFQYSNMGYSLLGAISEKIGGNSWSNLIQKEIFDPLGMVHSNSSISELTKKEDFSMPYSVNEGEPVRVLFDSLYESSPGGAINSSSNEMALWIRMLLNGGMHENEEIIPKDYLERAFSDHTKLRQRFSFDTKDEMQFDNYGYGWAVQNYLGHYRVNHTGAVSGFTATMDIFPFDSLGIVVLSNQHLSAIPNHVADMIIRRMLDKRRISWQNYEVRYADARMYDEPMQNLNEMAMSTLSLESYTGNYHHPGYGSIKVFTERGHLYIEFPAFKLGLEHLEHDTFFNKGVSPIHQNCPSFNMTFVIEGEEVTGLHIPFGPEGVVFEKKE